MWRWGYQFILQGNDTMWSHPDCSVICNRRLVSPTAKVVRGGFTLGKWSFSGEAGEFTSCSSQGSSLELGLQVLRPHSQHACHWRAVRGLDAQSATQGSEWSLLQELVRSSNSPVCARPRGHLELASPGRNSGNSGTYWRRHVWRPLQIWNKVNDFSELSVQLHWVMKSMM